MPGPLARVLDNMADRRQERRGAERCSPPQGTVNWSAQSGQAGCPNPVVSQDGCIKQVTLPPRPIDSGSTTVKPNSYYNGSSHQSAIDISSGPSVQKTVNPGGYQEFTLTVPKGTDPIFHFATVNQGNLYAPYDEALNFFGSPLTTEGKQQFSTNQAKNKDMSVSRELKGDQYVYAPDEINFGICRSLFRQGHRLNAGCESAVAANTGFACQRLFESD